MLHSIIKENSYQDSVNLMLLTNKISTMDGVKQASIMMGTPANKEIFQNTGMFTDELEKAGPNDMCIVIDTDDEDKVAQVLTTIEEELKNQAISSSKQEFESVRTWDKAMQALPKANLALISVPGQYAAEEAEKALDRGLHAFIFSDNVTIEDELRLKQKAHEKGLLVMGPDCGTGILSGVPVAFANVVKEGNIGVVGASGTGIQEVTTLIDRLGGGVSHAIGTGGRDLSETIGAITMLDAIAGLEKHQATEVIVVISKPPAKEVRNQVVQLLQRISKPVVAIFVGEEPEAHEGSVYYAHTLEETAMIAVDLSKGKEIKANYNMLSTEAPKVELKPEQTAIKGLYSGGTLAYETAILMSKGLELGQLIHEDGYMLKAKGHEVIDLGDDKYTQGKPHPMIDPETRIHYIEQAALDESTAIILLDVVLGYGAHDDMASALLPVIEKAQRNAREKGKNLYFVATVCGTEKDPQDYHEQKQKLEQAGVIVKESNNQAVRTALAMMGIQLKDKEKSLVASNQNEQEDNKVSESIVKLLSGKPVVVNVGLKKFVNAVTSYGGSAVHFDWRPVAGGNERMRKILSLLK
ncbi:acyl-CoA synthetase FdrA [Brevibacillus laterosporus]|uniref:acyl-CoA synthetase FdrA n=1 Tax=Brevibacillus laterosporus TaxID=1465 RepID=UPI0002404B7E|nr:acyl-CoA synthetase FdrA [Brevibacillus laterosporus]AUM65093.1 acyl-CoA synthetase FdrA [Brevibacillus laterosporus]CCF14333.1 protein fdrA [Brevibacillus laterosporus GI-9]